MDVRDLLFYEGAATTVVLIVAILCVGVLLDRIEKTTTRWLDGPYEQSLYNAVAEMFKTEQLGDAYKTWQKNLDFLAGLRLHWIPGVRKRLGEIHAEKEDKFDGAVQVAVDPRRPNRGPNLELSPWTAVLLDEDGKEIRRWVSWTRLTIGNEEEQRRLLGRFIPAANLLIIDHHDRVVGRVEKEQPD